MSRSLLTNMNNDMPISQTPPRTPTQEVADDAHTAAYHATGKLHDAIAMLRLKRPSYRSKKADPRPGEYRTSEELLVVALSLTEQAMAVLEEFVLKE